MRIAYLLADPGIGPFGTKGAGVHVQEMLRAMRAEGHEVSLFCTKRGDRPGRPRSEHVPEDLADVPVHVVEVPAASDPAAREVAIAETAARLAELVAAEAPELIYERLALFSAAGAQAAQACGSRLAVEVNAPLIDEHRAHRGLVDEPAARRAAEQLLAAADVVSCVSAPVAAWAERLRAESSTQEDSAREDSAREDSAREDSPVVVIPNGVDVERIRPRQAAPASSGFRIGFVGTLKPWHGTELLLRAVAAGAAGADGADGTDGTASAAQDPGRWQVEICGRGPELEPLQTLAEELGLAEQVTFHGPVPPQRIPDVLTGLDAAVAPYPAPESAEGHYFSPLKVYEYLAAGVPTVASAVGELPALLEQGRCGMLVPPGDVDALAAALRRLAADPALRERLGAAGRAAVVEGHTWRHRWRRLQERLQEVVPA